MLHEPLQNLGEGNLSHLIASNVYLIFLYIRTYVFSSLIPIYAGVSHLTVISLKQLLLPRTWFFINGDYCIKYTQTNPLRIKGFRRTRVRVLFVYQRQDIFKHFAPRANVPLRLSTRKTRVYKTTFFVFQLGNTNISKTEFTSSATNV